MQGSGFGVWHSAHGVWSAKLVLWTIAAEVTSSVIDFALRHYLWTSPNIDGKTHVHNLGNVAMLLPLPFLLHNHLNSVDN